MHCARRYMHMYIHIYKFRYMYTCIDWGSYYHLPEAPVGTVLPRPPPPLALLQSAPAGAVPLPLA